MTTLETVVGSSQSDQIEQTHQEIVLDYLLAASTHGMRSVGRAYSTFNRVFWIIMFTIALGSMLYFVISAIIQYYAYPTQTKVEINLDRMMPFPAVTICSANPSPYDRINVSLVNYFYRRFSSNATFNQTTLDSLQIPLFTDLMNRNQIEEIWSVGFYLTDMLLSCTYNGIDCSNAFIPSVSSLFGNCFTFNWQTSTQFFTLGNFSNTFVLYEGLIMEFYIPQEMYFPTTLADGGLSLMVHNNNELPIPNENGINLQPASSYLITYRKTETISLPKPYTTCTSEVSADMRALYETTFLNYSASIAVQYSETICNELCEQSYLLSQCSCIFPLPFFTRNVLTLDGHLLPANSCDPLTSQTQCAFDAQQNFSASSDLQTLWCSRCNSQCQRTDFLLELSEQVAPSSATKAAWKTSLLQGINDTKIMLPNDFAQNFDYYFDRNYLKLRVACGSKYVTVYQQEAKLSVIDTFSAIGGQTGLWIGLSVLSVIELSELVYRLVAKHFKRWNTRRHSRITPVIQTIHILEKGF